MTLPIDLDIFKPSSPLTKPCAKMVLPQPVGIRQNLMHMGLRAPWRVPGKWDPGGLEHARPDHSVEPDDVLPNHMALGRPELAVGTVVAREVVNPLSAGCDRVRDYSSVSDV